jgi:Ser/Thr protein kinase RdoA (MazF antagonist)
MDTRGPRSLAASGAGGLQGGAAGRRRRVRPGWTPGRQFRPGPEPHPGPWADDHVERVGALLKSLHESTVSFTPADGALWQDTWLHQIGNDGDLVIGHGDAAPWNIVGRDGQPEALVDWEFAGPIDRFTELAYAVWLNAQLHDDDIAELQGLPDAKARAHQVHAILDGYELPSKRRGEVVERMIEVAVARCSGRSRAGQRASGQHRGPRRARIPGALGDHLARPQRILDDAPPDPPHRPGDLSHAARPTSG